jgi:hypothetical protein
MIKSKRLGIVIILIISFLIILYYCLYLTGYIKSKFLDQQLAQNDQFVVSKLGFEDTNRLNQSNRDFVKNYILNNKFEREIIVRFELLHFSIAGDIEEPFLVGHYINKENATFDFERTL